MEDGQTNLTPQQDVKLILGADYAGIVLGEKTTIYDFKLNRILTLTPDYKQDGTKSGKMIFTNGSLFATAFRDMTNVRRATKNGSLRTLELGNGVELDAFWIESAMSWTARPPRENLQIDHKENHLSVERAGQKIFAASFTDDKYLAPVSGGSLRGVGQNSFLVFAHHEWPLHPQILDALYSYDSPPENLEMVSYGPTAPKGQKQVNSPAHIPRPKSLSQ